MAAKHSDNEDASGPSTERRNYFRISDRIGLEIRRHDADNTSPESPFDDSHLETLRAELRRMDQDVRSQLASLAERDRLLSSLMKSLNAKIDIMARIMAFEQNPLQPEDWQTVTLSEGGLAFETATGDYCVNEHLAMRLTLPPELFQPLATASILSLEPCDTSRYRVHTEFVDIHDHDRQQIARHVLRWQARQRQKE